MTERILIVAAAMGAGQMIRDAVRWYRGIDGCRACHVLGQVPYGPPYWLLRAHLCWVVRNDR